MSVPSVPLLSPSSPLLPLTLPPSPSLLVPGVRCDSFRQDSSRFQYWGIDVKLLCAQPACTCVSVQGIWPRGYGRSAHGMWSDSRRYRPKIAVQAPIDFLCYIGLPSSPGHSGVPALTPAMCKSLEDLGWPWKTGYLIVIVWLFVFPQIEI